MRQFSLPEETKLVLGPSEELYTKGNPCKFRGKIKFYSGKFTFNSENLNYLSLAG